MKTCLSLLLDDLELYQREAYEISQRVLLDASNSMAVGYGANGRVKLGQEHPDFFFCFTEKEDGSSSSNYIDQQTWDHLILGI